MRRGGVLIALIVVLVLQNDAESRREAKIPSKKSQSMRNNRRKMILCCGRASCLDVVGMKKPNATTLGSRSQPTNSINSKTSVTSNEALPTTTTPSVTESVAQEVATSPETSAPQTDAPSTDGPLMEATSSESPPETTTTQITNSIESSSVQGVETTSTSTSSYSVAASIATSTTSSIISSSPSPSSDLTSTEASSLITTTTPKTTIIPVKPTTPTTQAAKVLPSCPTACTKERSFFKSDGSLDDPDYHGFWKTACGQLYLFGKVAVNWEQNVEACCKLGMVPITFNTSEIHQCFEKFIDGPKWSFNTRYWTSAIRQQGITFRWCQGNSIVNSTLWALDQPTYKNNSDNCAQLIVDRVTSSVRIDDRSCGAISAMACQGPPTPAPPCLAPVCPNVTCTKNMNLYKVAQDNQTVYLKNPKALGTWASLNRSYLFSFPNDTKTYFEAMKACCGVGMKLISLHLDFRYSNLVDALKSTGASSGQFWTSGTDLGCEDSFGYCSTNRLLRDEAKWKPGQPDNLNGNESCVSVEVAGGSALISDSNCNQRMRYVCEGLLGGGVDDVEIECAAAFNLTREHVKTLLVTMPSTLSEKCFLRCFGEGTELFVNGKLQENKIMAQFSSLATGDMDKLMDMYSTMNFCSNMTRGMDMCDKAAKLLECGKENSPEAVAGLMTNLETAFTEAPVLLPPNKGICPSHTCIIDDQRKKAFDLAANRTALPTLPGVIQTMVTHACGKKFLVLNIQGPVSHAKAMEACCSFGLRMVMFRTKAELDCFHAAKIQGHWTYDFTVYGSRMDFAGVPVWCNGDPINLTWADDGITTDTNTTKFVVYFSSGTATRPRFTVWVNQVNNMVCETL